VLGFSPRLERRSVLFWSPLPADFWHSALYASNRGTHSSMISECFHGVSFMKSRRHFPVMLGEYWIYVLAGVISITTLMLLYSHNGPIELLRWW
jgi:hypothetical protein